MHRLLGKSWHWAPSKVAVLTAIMLLIASIGGIVWAQVTSNAKDIRETQLFIRDAVSPYGSSLPYHIAFVHTVEQNHHTHTAFVEIWIDDARNRALLVNGTLEGNPRTSILVIDDAMYESHEPDGFVTRTIGIDAEDPRLLAPKARLWYASALYQAGHLTKIRAENGQLVVEGTDPSIPDTQMQVLLDEETNLPLRISYDTGYTNVVHEFEYLSIQELNRESNLDDIFVPPSLDRIARTYTLHSEGDGFDFPVYHLGATFAEFEVDEILQVQSHPNVVLPVEPHDAVFVIYRHPDVGAGISDELSVASQLLTDEQLAHTPTEVFDRATMGRLIGNVWVTLKGRSDSEVLEMLEALERFD